MINTSVSNDLGREKKNEVLKKIQDQYGKTEEKSRDPVKKLGKDEFFKIMVTQLKNQDPLKPYDNEQMAAQMAQFTSLEQMFNMNSNLEKLSDSQKPLHHLGAAGLIGKWVTSDASRATHTEGKYTTYNFELPAQCKTVRISILNEKGEVVREIEKNNLAKGPHVIEWDGRNKSNMLVSSGTYSVQIRAENERGQSVPVSMKKKMQVHGVAFEGNETVLMVGDNKSPQKVLLRTVSQIESDESSRAKNPVGAVQTVFSEAVADAKPGFSKDFMPVNLEQFGMGSNARPSGMTMDEALSGANMGESLAAEKIAKQIAEEQNNSLKAANPVAAQIAAAKAMTSANSDESSDKNSADRSVKQ
jgi:flagellar hook assembly protein FlgD